MQGKVTSRVYNDGAIADDDDDDNDDDDDDTHLSSTQVLHSAGQSGDVSLTDCDVHLAGYKARLRTSVFALPTHADT